MLTQDDVLDLSVKKPSLILLSPPSSTTSSSSSSSKRIFDSIPQTTTSKTNKRPLRFQCKHCDYKAPSTSLMQNHIYRHTDLTPYSCAYCGHKSTTKSTIMVHIELCHPHMEVKILENRVREQDFYRDLNASEISACSNTTHEPQVKKVRRSKQYDSESTPINGVAVSLKTIVDDGYDLSPTSDEFYETDHLDSMLLPASDILDDIDEEPSLKLNISPPMTQPLSRKNSQSEDGCEYLLVYNRPKQYYGSLYEPDKQYACRLCSYTTNHRPSMEDHVFVHTNEKPYKCGYCGDEIHTRYAATYHIKYKHTGMARNFIQNKADISQYYINRAKEDDEKNQFKSVDTRRVKLPIQHSKFVTKSDVPIERPVQPKPSPVVQSMETQLSVNGPGSTVPDYRFLMAWSYYLAAQAAWLPSPSQGQQGQTPPSFPTDPEMAAKFLQAMQTVMNSSSNHGTKETTGNSDTTHPSPIIKQKTKN